MSECEIDELSDVFAITNFLGITSNNDDALAKVEPEQVAAQPEQSLTPVEPTPEPNILSTGYWKTTNSFKTIANKESQLKYYKRMNACEEILQLVELESKRFGSETEKIIVELLQLDPRTSTQHDGTLNGKKIEIKIARYWTGTDDCKWQHLEPEHDYEYAVFGLLDFHGFKLWCIKKSLLMGELRDKKIVTKQGKQGFWVKKNAVLPYLTPINTRADLAAFMQE